MSAATMGQNPVDTHVPPTKLHTSEQLCLGAPTKNSGVVLGLVDGLIDGLALGEVDGLAEGLADGEELGLVLGIREGLADGLALGEALGIAVGDVDGAIVGVDVGAGVGIDVGEASKHGQMRTSVERTSGLRASQRLGSAVGLALGTHSQKQRPEASRTGNSAAATPETTSKHCASGGNSAAEVGQKPVSTHVPPTATHSASQL